MPGATEGDLELRWAGLRAHNRWLADFCAAAPGRRLGIVQIMLHDVPAAVAEVEWAAEAGMTAGILLPGAPPARASSRSTRGSTTRSGGPARWRAFPSTTTAAAPCRPSGTQDIDKVMFMLEVTWWAHRSLWHLIFAGVLERHPDLQFVFTEQGTAWIPETLGTLDFFFYRMGSATGSQELEWGQSVVSAALACGRASTGPASATSGRASCARPRRPCATRSAWTRSCGAATTPTGSPAIRSATRRSGSPSPASIPSRSSRCSAGNAADLFGFDLEGLERRGRTGWVRPTTRSAEPLRS